MDISLHVAKIYAEGDLLLGNILSSMPRVMTTSIKTAAVGVMPGSKVVSLMYNPDFMESLEPEQIRAVLRHEAMHIAFSHIPRSSDKTHLPWNIATDMFINQNVKNLPECGVELPEEYRPNLSSDEYYNTLLEDKEKWEDYSNSSGFDDHASWEEIFSDPSVVDELEKKVEELVNRAAEAGDKTARAAKEMRPKKNSKDWAVEIRRMFSPSSSEVSYRANRFDKRRVYHNNEEMIPARINRPNRPNIYVAVDTSASITEDDLMMFAGEINNMVRYSDVTCMMFDTMVHSQFKWRKVLDQFKAEGFGGTDFQDVFEKVSKDRDCDGLIILTDGWASLPQNVSKVKTLWALTKSHNEDVANWFGKSVVLPF